MLLPCRDMGCGRSKHRSRENSMTDMNDDPKAKRKSSSKQKKSTEKKENQDPSPSVKLNQNSNKTVGPKPIESGVLKMRRLTPSHNGAVHQSVQSESKDRTKDDRMIQIPDEKYSKPVGSKEKTGEGTNQHIRVTNSQLEFFKMLDDKIEQGQDYYTDSDESLLEETESERVRHVNNQ